jgi:hypothetical protein
MLTLIVVALAFIGLFVCEMRESHRLESENEGLRRAEQSAQRRQSEAEAATRLILKSNTFLSQDSRILHRLLRDCPAAKVAHQSIRDQLKAEELLGQLRAGGIHQPFKTT